MPVLAPVMTTARLPLRPQRHSPGRERACPEARRDLGCPGAELGIEGLPVAPAHRVPRGTDTPTRDDPRAAADRRRGGGSGRTRRGGDRVRGLLLAQFCRLSDMPRDVGGPSAKPTHGQKGWTPRQILKQVIYWVAPNSLRAPLRRCVSGRLGEWVQPVAGQSAQRFHRRDIIVAGVSPTAWRTVFRDRASVPAETVHGRSPRFGRRMGAYFVGAGAAAASRHAACDDLVPPRTRSEVAWPGLQARPRCSPRRPWRVRSNEFNPKSCGSVATS